MTNVNEWPIVAPLFKLLESRKFLLAISVIVTYLVTHAVPALLPYADGISTIILVALGPVFLHLSVEDILKLRAGLEISVAQAVTDARTEFAGAVATGIIGGTVTTTTTSNSGPSVVVPPVTFPPAAERDGDGQFGAVG